MDKREIGEHDMSQSIGVYDHDTTNSARGELVKRISSVTENFPSVTFHLVTDPKDELAGIEELKQCNIVVGHFGQEANWDRLNSISGPGSIRIRTSTAGRVGHQHTIQNGVFVLQFQPRHTDVTSEEWKAIIEYLLTENAAQSIVDGNIPSEMTDFFGTGNLEILPALSILCQGYLHVEKNMPLRVAEVRNKCFWCVFGGRTTKQLTTSARAEWNGLKGSGDFAKVENLLSQLNKEEIQAVYVVEANSAITSRLGANSGG
jgi:hypothetical protein